MFFSQATSIGEGFVMLLAILFAVAVVFGLLALIGATVAKR
jgi:hypothetical protein